MEYYSKKIKSFFHFKNEDWDSFVNDDNLFDKMNEFDKI